MNKFLSLSIVALIAFSLFSVGFVYGLDNPSDARLSADAGPKFLSNEFLVKLKESPSSRGAGSAALDVLNAEHDVAEFGRLVPENIRSKDSSLSQWYRVVLPAPRLIIDQNSAEFPQLQKVIGAYRRNPDVLAVEPNYIVYAAVAPDDPSFSQLYGLHNTGQTGGTADADIDAPEAWDLQTGSSSALIAVIDSGVDYNHADLSANIWTNLGEIAGNGIDDDANGFIDDTRGWDFYNNDNDPFDDHGHGTHVSGTIGAVGNNGVGVVGVNWNVKIMPLKFLGAGGSGTTANAVSAVNYATLMGAHITSNSWGGGGFSQALEDAISAANDAGILFVAAAGNDGTNNDAVPHYPSSYDVPNVVAVAATDNRDLKASFSNYGANSVDLGAPGVSILSTVHTGSCSLCSPSGYRSASGTSMATPHVSGAAGLIKAQFPALTSDGIKARLLGSVDVMPSMEGITSTEGRLNARDSLQNDDIAPSQVVDLAAANSLSRSVTLEWTATGDDGNTGRAKRYDVRYSTQPITDASWNNAVRAAGEPSPQDPGTAETFDVTGLSPDTTYYFALKVVDEVGNPSALSNVVSGTTTTPTAVFSDSMENGVNGWTANSLWHQETRRAYSPVRSWAYNTGSPNYNYNIGINSGSLTSPAIDLTAFESAFLTFNYLYRTETSGTGYDQRWIQISINGGSFQNLRQLSDDIMLAWNNYGVDLSSYAGNTVQIRFFFNTVDEFYNNYEGWYIDDVTVSGDLAENSTPNNPPVANANGPYSGIEDIPVVFNSSGSYDIDNDTLTYHWNFGDGLTGSGASPDHSYASGGNHTVILIVNDGRTDSAPSITTATIADVNDAPVANAGSDKVVLDSDGDGAESVVLNGSASFDTDGTIVAYEWKEGATILGNTAVLAADFALGAHAVTLTVTDNEGLSASDNVTVTVATPVVVDLRVNGVDGPITVDNGSIITLSWTTSGGATFCTAIDAWTGAKDPAGGSEQKGPLAGPRQYTYMLYCSNNLSSHIDSVTVNVSAPLPQPPPAPTDLAATPGNAQVTLSWSSSPGASSYNVKRSTISGGPYSLVGSTSATSFTDTGLTNGVAYFYVVTAVNSAGESTNSNEASATPVAPPDTTPPVTAITAPADGATVKMKSLVTITASASDNVGVTKVEFFVNDQLKCTDTTAPYSCGWNVPPGKDKSYQIQSRAYDAASNVGYSTVISVKSTA